MTHEHHIKDDRGWWACFAHVSTNVGFRWLYDHEPNKITKWKEGKRG